MRLIQNANPVKKYVSECIPPEEIKEWVPGEIILIAADTGLGKSHFVKTVLRAYLKENGLKCLYLLSRLRTKQQFEAELRGDETIKFMLYQAVEAAKEDFSANLGEWDIIIADESHYFLSDSSFNNRTDVSFDWIMEQTNATRVFMSATNDGLETYFNWKRICFTEYVIHYGYSQIRSLTFFWNEAQLAALAQQIIESGRKGIFFIQSAEKAYDLYQQFKGCGMFLCSPHNKKYAQYLDDGLISDLLESENFDCTLLFTTTALDTGANIKDRSLTNVVIDVTDPSNVIQCVGRKRFVSEDDFADLYIRARTNNQIGGYIKKLREKDATVKKFLEQGAVSYNSANDRSNDGTGLIFDAPESIGGSDTPLFRKRVNELKYAQIQQSIGMYQEMLQLGDCSYVKYVAQLLNRKNYTILEAEQRTRSLTEYLDSIAGTPLLTARDREPLIQHLNVTHNRRLCKRGEVLATWLKTSGLPYRLIEYATSRSVNGVKKKYKAWKIIKVDD